MFRLSKSGFTLAEVLVTMTILGVVAAISMPSIIQHYKEKIYVISLKKAYALLYNVCEMSKVENGPITTWDIGTKDSKEGSKKLSEYFTKYIKKYKTCENNDCFADNYKGLFTEEFSNDNPRAYKYYQSSISTNNVSVMFLSGGNIDCRGDRGWCGAIFIDINGKKGPNRTGIDYFFFDIYRSISAPYSSGKCKYNDSSPQNGSYCTGWVIKHGNMDYLRRDISKEKY